MKEKNCSEAAEAPRGGDAMDAARPHAHADGSGTRPMLTPQVRPLVGCELAGTRTPRTGSATKYASLDGMQTRKLIHEDRMKDYAIWQKWRFATWWIAVHLCLWPTPKTQMNDRGGLLTQQA